MKAFKLFDSTPRLWPRILIGALAGMAAYLFLSWLTQPGSFFGVRLTWAFTFCFNGNVPEAVGAVLGFLLWGAFGAEIALSTLPFAEDGKALLVRSLAHFFIMGLTLWAWVLLNFTYEPLPGLALTFLLPYALLYLLIWLLRWVKWYLELWQLRRALGLTPGKEDRP